jgi:cell wall assembly regulator SMI1
LLYANRRKRKRLKFDEKEVTRARDRIHQALGRLIEGLQTLDSKLLQHVNVVVERTAVDVRDTKAGVERTEKGVERTEKGVERTEKGVERTEKGVERTAIVVEDTKAGVKRAEQGVERLHIRKETKDRTLERQRILDWICPSKVDYADRQNALRKERQTGIGEWFLDSDEFKNWMCGDRATILCSGMPGVGKTMITSFVVSNALERYENDTQTGLAYIYCQFSRHREQTPQCLMSATLRQLLEQHDTMPDEVRSLYMTRKGEDDLTFDEILNLLDFVLSLFKKSILVIDALDELRSAACKGVVSQMLAFQKKFNVNVYATSRYMKEIAEETPNATQVDIRTREEDLRRSLDVTLKHGFLLSKRPDLQQRALSAILQATDGM